jgi:short-subunit dehydrogenase
MRLEPGTPCLVTGASSGIGRAIAMELGRRGCRVALLARSEGPLRELAGEIAAAGGASGGEGLALPADVTSEEQVAAAVEAAAERFGGLRVVVANAGLGRYAPVAEQPAEHVDVTIQTNYVGLTRTIRHALPHLLAGAPSHLVGVTSSAGLIPHATASAYCASKAASNAYLAALRVEVKGRGVGVTTLCPGLVETPFIERADLEPARHMPRLANWTVPPLTAEEVARAAVRAVVRDRREVVMPFMMRFFVAFRRLAPGFGDWIQRVTG